MIGMDQSACKDDGGEKVGPEELLEKCWFFGNLLDTKTRMLRALSEPCTSSNYSHENLPAKSYEEAYESINKLPSISSCSESRGHNPTAKTITSNHLLRAPSLPTSLEAEEFQDEEMEFSMGKLIRQASLNNSDTKRPRTRAAKVLNEETYESIKKLPSISSCSESHGHNPTAKTISSNHLLRAPSLPTSLEAEEFQDEEMEFSMGKLIRQASLNTTRPRTRATKATSSLSRHQSRKKPEVNSLKFDGLEKIRSQSIISPLMKQKSLSYLGSEQLLSFKDSVSDSDSKDLNSGAISTIPGLQEKKIIEEDAEKNLSPVPNWGGNRSTEDPMKAQIKFWARAVATNVRQEC